MKRPLRLKTMIIKIKNKREALGWSQRRLADETKKHDPKGKGYSHSYIGEIESARINPSLKALDMIAKALGTDRAYLIQEEPGEYVYLDEHTEHLSLKEKEFVKQQENRSWIRLNIEMARKGLSPEKLRKAVQIAEKLKKELTEE